MKDDVTCLISGGLGFIGSALARSLERSGTRVLKITRDVSRVVPGRVLHCDICNFEQVDNIVDEYKPNFVVHLGADTRRNMGGFTQYRKAIEYDLLGIINFAESVARLDKFKRFLFLGSCEEYGANSAPYKEVMRESPASPYAALKTNTVHLLQSLHRSHEFPVVVLRPTIVYGPGQKGGMFIPSLIESLLKRQNYPMSTGKQKRDFIFIDDLVEACESSLTNDNAIGKIMNIGAGKSLAIEEVARKVAISIGDDSLALIKFGSLPYRDNELMDYAADVSLAKSVLGWQSKTPLDMGIKYTLQSHTA